MSAITAVAVAISLASLALSGMSVRYVRQTARLRQRADVLRAERLAARGE